MIYIAHPGTEEEDGVVWLRIMNTAVLVTDEQLQGIITACVRMLPWSCESCSITILPNADGTSVPHLTLFKGIHERTLLTRHDVDLLSAAREVASGPVLKPIATMTVENMVMTICDAGGGRQVAEIYKQSGPSRYLSATDLLELKPLTDKFLAHYIEGRGKML